MNPRLNSCARSSTGSTRAAASDLKPVRYRQAFLLEKGGIEELRLVARARVGEDRHHRMAGAESARQANRTRDVDAARAAEDESFLFHQIKNDGHRLGIRYLIGVIDLRMATFFVTRPWPMPSVIDDPSDLSSPRLNQLYMAAPTG